ncbi:acyl-CoA dehydrogenase [Actinosynnema sp. ALI-1.44]|uniref:acyl-CoA dehydrogenase family protein n=1 Tax=Actinosynnema sp. ALI-1.44 TaxID=1933779 RepID=UPI00097BD4AA|nr:acyl-CoA dehydrogenase family protein [Actinosynnema sp. ALI-1.44]ONI91640.1 acyl-CoA dehydrogenase [Actinosynnema sp. ALI-1.44]
MSVEDVAAFLRQHVIPVEAELDTGSSTAMRDLRDKARAEGLWALPLPADLGGGGLSLRDYFGLAEAEGSSDHGPAALGSASLLDVRMISTHGSRTVREHYLRPLVAGEISGSYAMTEPGVAGSAPTLTRTTAQRTTGGWAVTGRKWFTSGASAAAYVTVLTRTAPDELSLLMVPTSQPGFRVVRELPVLGAGGQFEIEFTAAHVPDDHLLGVPGDGLVIAATRLALGRTLRCMRWVGQAQRAFDLMCRRANDRHVHTGPLAGQQLVQRLVFDSLLVIRSARALVAQAADLVARGEDAKTEIGLAKVAAAGALQQVADAAIQVYGAEGLTADTPLPMLARLGRAARILDGPDELHVSATARRVLKQFQAEGEEERAPDQFVADRDTAR